MKRAQFLVLLLLLLSNCSSDEPTSTPQAFVSETEGTDPEAASKPTMGVVKKLELGDRGCYVDLVGMDGDAFRELAVPEICEQEGILEKPVQLTYSDIEVLAAACEGDPDCREMESLFIISSASPMRRRGQQ